MKIEIRENLAGFLETLCWCAVWISLIYFVYRYNIKELEED